MQSVTLFVNFLIKSLLKKVYSRTLKYSHNKNKGLRIIRIYIFALLYVCQLIFVSISISYSFIYASELQAKIVCSGFVLKNEKSIMLS